MTETLAELNEPAETKNMDKVETISLLGIKFEKQALITVGFTFVLSRVMVMFVIFISSIVLAMQPGLYLYADPNNVIIDGLIRDDSWWYQNIVTTGYSMGDVTTQTQGNVAFFPLYPLSVKLVTVLTGNVFLAGVLVSHLSFLVALWYLYKLTQLEFGKSTAERAIFYLAVAPTTVFFSAMYTESLFIALVAGTFYYARTHQWDRAALFGALASATRNTGILMAVVIVLECLSQQGFRFIPTVWTRQAILEHLKNQIRPVLRSWPGLIAGIFACLGLVGYMTYLTNTFGDPLAFIHVQATWGRSTSPGAIFNIIQGTRQGLNIGSNIWAGQIDVNTLLNLLSLLGFAPLVVAVALKMRPAYSWFTVLTFLIPLSTGTIGSMTRYVLMLIPCFMFLAHLGRRPWVDRLVLGIFLPLSAYLAIIFSHWSFAG